MSEQKRASDHLLAMKAELEKLGCIVTIDPEPDEEGFITVRITYPSDVPPADEVL